MPGAGFKQGLGGVAEAAGLRRETQLACLQEEGSGGEWEGAEVLLLLRVVAGVGVVSGQGPGTAGRQRESELGPLAGDPLPSGSYSGTPIPCLLGLSTQF